MEYTGEEVGSSNFAPTTGDGFINIIVGGENLIIENTDVVVIGNSGTEGSL